MGDSIAIKVDTRLAVFACRVADDLLCIGAPLWMAYRVAQALMWVRFKGPRDKWPWQGWKWLGFDMVIKHG